MKTTKNYILFLHKILIKKANTFIIPLLWFIISIISGITLSQINLANQQKTFIVYVYVFIELLVTILFASLKSLNLFKDLEEEGIELLTLSKPISRKNILIAKNVTNLMFGFYWTVIILISNLIIFGSINLPLLGLISLYSILVFFLAYTIFSIISSLIAFKLNAKIAITLPLVLFSPLAIGGTVVASKSTSVPNNYAFYLNSAYKNHASGNRVNAEKFYLNNDKDNLYIIPNGLPNKKFRDDQNEYLTKAFEISANSSKDWQAYSYLILPYQMIDIFNYNNENIFNSFSNIDDFNNLKNYLYYNKQDSFVYGYTLKLNSDLKRYKVLKEELKLQDENGEYVKDEAGSDIIYKRIYKNVFLVPGSLKNQTQIPNLSNTNLIYAHSQASSFEAEFPEDKFVHSTSDNLVGEIKWQFIDEILKNPIFVSYAKEFYDQIKSQTNSIENIEEVKDIIFSNITESLKSQNDKKGLLDIEDKSSVLFNENSLNNRTIKTLSEKKLYFATALLYYAYFNFNDSKILDAILYNPRTQAFDPHSVEVKIDEGTYRIGGYSSFETKQEVIDKKIKIRYDLNPSENYMFQTLDQVVELSRNNHKIIEKNSYFVIWIIIALLLILANYKLYYKKDYK
ncbi:ABC transporter permease [Mycoplasma leonicaptivi]|uniref:ABC transporter permease n=1 Tax=Mycoplasma leonicaptivi TaxID=36742 RepID=UPI0004876C7F|nr:ABC transporter permease [Mycoplasma leonicaptivi]